MHVDSQAQKENVNFTVIPQWLEISRRSVNAEALA